MQQLSHLDAAQTAFFLRDLEKTKNKSYDIQYPEYRGRRFVPASDDPTPSGAETITYLQYDRVGMARLIASYADDLPRSDVLGVEFTSRVKSIGASFGYNIQEIRAGAMMNRSLPAMKAFAARQTLEEKIDEVIAIGNSASGLTGMINNASVPSASVSGGVWSGKTGDQIVADINEQLSTMLAATRGIEMPDTLLMPITGYSLISTKARSTGTDLTVLEYIKKSFPNLTLIDHWYRLPGAGSGATDRMVMYKRSPMKLFYEVPQEVEFLSPEVRGLEFIVAGHARVGGTIIPYPLSMSYRDGI